MNRDPSVLARRTLEGAAIVACAAGVGVWGAILLAPEPAAAPPALAAAPVAAADTGPVAGWFGAGPAARVQIVSSGLIAAGPSGSAILSVDGGRPRAYGVGQQLAQDLVLADVRPTAIVVEQGGQPLEIAAPRLAPAPQGFVPVATAPAD